MASTCLFCRIIAREIPAGIIYENEHVLAFLDIGPVSEGHTLVIPKEHADNLSAGSAASAEAIMKAVHYLAPKIMEAVGAAGYNLGMNHGVVAGQEVMHTHVHIMPRKDGEPRSFAKTHPTPEVIAQVAEKITSLLA
jgi:histidine triad (HIT) family protein